jgi:RimJ/RimL family protein N-acetyltransferase
VRLLFGYNAEVAEWVYRHIPGMPRGFANPVAIGVMDAEGVRPMAGVVFHDYEPEFGTIQLSAAAVSPQWASRNIIKTILQYPFEELKVQKVWTATKHSNARALKFNEGVGFTREATLRDHFGLGAHAVICRMLSKDYRRLYGQ